MSKPDDIEATPEIIADEDKVWIASGVTDSSRSTDEALVADVYRAMVRSRCGDVAIEAKLPRLEEPRADFVVTNNSDHSGAARFAVAAELIRNVYRRHGLIETVNLGLHELLFDLYYRTSTAIDPCTSYESSNPLLFRRMLDHLPQEARYGAFLDYGSGKGRALMLAASKGFTRVLGVDVSSNLCSIARQNAAIYATRHRGCSIMVHNHDAAEMEVPADVIVVYLYNPFGLETLRAVIGRLSASLRQVPRPLWAVYMVPRHGNLFLSQGFTSIFNRVELGAIFHVDPSRGGYGKTKQRASL
jgi:hypothetical protein